MTIEELNEIKWYVDEEVHTKEIAEKLHSILDEKISQLSVTDEDVKEAIEHIRIIKTNHGLQKDEYQSLDIAITALQQMRTEGCHSCKGIESHGIKSVKTVTDKLGRDIDAYNTPYNYCPNCGRKLR